MKTRLFLPLALLLLSVFTGLSQNSSEAPEYWKTVKPDWKTVTPDELSADIKNSPTAAQGQHELLIGALQSERMDLIQECFAKPGTLSWFEEELSALKSEPLKEAIVLMMLKTPSNFWPSEDLRRTKVHFPGSSDSQTVIAVIHEYLPEVVYDESLILTQAARTVLVAKIEKAMLLRNGPSPATPPDQVPSGSADKGSKIQPSAIQGSKAGKPAAAPPSSPLFKIALAALACLVLAGIAFLLRKLRGGSTPH